jgi:hypothetical protein
MNKVTKAALEASIEKWKRNSIAEAPEKYLTGFRDCPLCDLFWDADCIGCPVFKRTGETGCYGTPYTTAEKARRPENWDFDGGALARKTALDEVVFLESLRE